MNAGADPGTAVAFYQDLHRAFDTTLWRGTDAHARVHTVLAQAFDCFHGNVALFDEEEPPLACHRGCAACCTLRVTATTPEVLLVAEFLRRVTPALLARGVDLVGQLRAADARTRGRGEVARVGLRQRCAFVAQGVCVIYAVRPLACRGHASHDARACADAAAGRVQQVPHSEAHRTVRAIVQAALQSALRDAGLAWGQYELNQALLLALDGEHALDDWLGGADPLASALVDDVPAGEMASAFDCLRPR